MPSRLQTDDAEHNEIQQMDRRLSDQRVSSHMERKPVKPVKAVENNVDDVVKYMSKVPSYLQRLEKGDNVQEKALNFGVLDWGRLEKWTYLQKQVDADRRGGSSPSSSNSSSSSSASLSTFGSSSKSPGSRSVQRKQSPTLNAREQNRMQLMRNPESRTSCRRPSEEGNIRHLNMKSNSNDKHRPPDVGSSSISKVDEIQDIAQNKAKSHICRSKEEKFHNCEQECFSGDLNFGEDWLQDQCSVVEGMWDQSPIFVSSPLPSTNMKLGQFMEGLSTKSSVIVTAKSGEGKAKVSSATRRELSPHRILNAGLNMIRNSTSGEGSSGQRMNQKIVPGNSRVENSTFHGKSRRSLSPHCQLHGMSQMRDSISREAEMEVISMKQALLKLAWKNELPLFVFSANDHDILAATMGKGNMSRTNDFNCNYMMFTAHEMKKKGGLWMGRRNKRKNHDLIYNVVGQMRVSSCKSTSSSPNDSAIMREFVLRGSELAPTAHGRVTLPFNSELAAIVIKVPTERPETIANVTAILPNGIHGMSSEGNPSPLIERWRSGGSCDCGGWDEGCILTVLTDEIWQSKSASSSKARSGDGTRRIELFPLGEDRENRHTFRMVAFKEGVYAVEFGGSIALVQAFAVCIAILHSKNPCTHSGHHCSTKAQGIASEKHPTSYVPIHPPLSPAERA